MTLHFGAVFTPSKDSMLPGPIKSITRYRQYVHMQFTHPSYTCISYTNAHSKEAPAMNPTAIRKIMRSLTRSRLPFPHLKPDLSALPPASSLPLAPTLFIQSPRYIRDR